MNPKRLIVYAAVAVATLAVLYRFGGPLKNILAGTTPAGGPQGGQ